MKQIQIFLTKIKDKFCHKDRNNLKFTLISEINLKNFSGVTKKQETLNQLNQDNFKAYKHQDTNTMRKKNILKI
jgi:hypothetical protein